MKVWIIFILFCLAAPLLLPAEDLWEGNAAVIRRGVFEVPGLYAASDSFPRNSLIVVENITNGRQVEVTVLERINGTGNVFLLLSEQAAEKIGLSANEVLPVRARIKMAPAGGVIGLPDDLTASPDPDVNPTASVPAPAAPGRERTARAPAAETAAAPTERVAAAAGAEDTAGEKENAPEKEKAPAEEKAPVPAAPGGQPPETGAPPLSPEEQRLDEVASRLPQKQVYMPPREDERYLVAAPVEEPPSEAAVIPAVPESEPETLTEEAEEAEAELSLAATAEPEAEEPEMELPGLDQLEPRETRGLEAEPEARGEIVSGPAPVPAPPPETPVPPAESAEAVAAAEESAPESFQLAELRPAPAAVEPTAAEEGGLPLVDALPPSAYFLQLAAYSGRERAEKLVAALQPVYTVTVLPVTRQNRRLYKVLIGPLNQEESGTLLYRFRSLGYKDAFITKSD